MKSSLLSREATASRSKIFTDAATGKIFLALSASGALSESESRMIRAILHRDHTITSFDIPGIRIFPCDSASHAAELATVLQ